AIAATIIVILTLLAGASVATAESLHRVTGGIHFTSTSHEDGFTRVSYLEFNAQAHEGMDVKGQLNLQQYNLDTELRRRWQFEPVKYLKVEGNMASFAALCTYPEENYAGMWIVVTVQDNGEPGWVDDDDGPDLVQWFWKHTEEEAIETVELNKFDSSGLFTFGIHGGNIQVSK
ncbi:hypothetical protein ACFLTV_00750, partial [Chloroflexota bacterium]